MFLKKSKVVACEQTKVFMYTSLHENHTNSANSQRTKCVKKKKKSSEVLYF